MPSVTTITEAVKALINAISLQKQETKLFQFLNGLDESYNQQTSQLLMSSPLPSVETASAVIQQEEAQREVLTKPDNDAMAMFSKFNPDRNTTCTACGGDRCWTIIGYPYWHTKHNPSTTNSQSKPKNSNPNQKKWTPGNRSNNSKMAANAHVSSNANSSGTAFTPQQLEQLAKMMPQLMMTKGSHTDEEIDSHFSGMISYNSAVKASNTWIIDSAASDHMTSCLDNLLTPKPIANSIAINLPTGDSVVISHTGNVLLETGFILNNVLCVPNFRHNLLSVQRLVKETNCEAHFYPAHCVILDATTKELKGLGKAENGLYYLINHLTEKIPSTWLQSKVAANSTTVIDNAKKQVDQNQTDAEKLLELWHHRLGHAPADKINKIHNYFIKHIYMETNL